MGVTHTGSRSGENAVPYTEPGACPRALRAFEPDCRKIGPFSPVFFHGEGPDNALRFEWQVFLFFLWRERRFEHLLHSLGSTMFSRGFRRSGEGFAHF